MDFDELVGHFRGMREAQQNYPLPIGYPPQLLCFDGETMVCSVASPRTTSQAIAAMLSAIAVSHADRAVYSMETLVREIGTHSMNELATPLNEDPSSKAALLMVDVETGPKNPDVRIDAFNLVDQGALEWVSGEWWSPLSGRLVGAIDEVLQTHVPNSVIEFVTWMQVNGYAIKMHESLYPKHDE